MPVVTLNYADLERLTGARRDEILNRIPMIGADIERIEEDYVDIEFFPDRPDLFSVEGVARAMRGFLGVETGLPNYDVKESDIKIHVEPSVKPVRPFVVSAVVRGLNITTEVIESLMGMQEDLHWGIGRNRKKVSIGVHDLSKVKPPFRYLAEDPGFSFVPLDYDEEMTMDEILREHPKGVKFASILEGMDKYPLILDSEGSVLSFPPIINGELTRVTESTEDVLLDVTGLDCHSINIAQNIVVTALAERGGFIESVLILDEGEKQTPDLNPTLWDLHVREVQKLIGVELTEAQCIECLEKMRFGAKLMDGGIIQVKVPAYRADILHPWDIIEDITIGYGYDKIEAIFPKTMTVGETHPLGDLEVQLREVMVGLGYYEVMTFTLTNERKHFEKMRSEIDDTVIRVKHQISEEYSMLRPSILPNLIDILSLNKHRELPQRLFEIGDVVVDSKNRLNLAGACIHSNANFAEIRSVVESVLRELGLKFEMTESENPSFLDGRRADVRLATGDFIATFGELHPEVIVNFGLEHPIIGFELNASDHFSDNLI
ncbi:MAG: phenylalanine--tRNA ligase subunit beta [Halobacteriota archaeon]|nr:phenylalanine--tRNA ligase subunit beta [Halobacteriota archaeon]